MTEKLHLIDELKKQINLTSKIKYPDFLTEFIYENNKIEGRNLSKQQIKNILKETKSINDYNKIEKDVIGQKDAFKYIVYLAKNNIQLSQIEIKNIHKFLLISKNIGKGTYRTIHLHIFGTKRKVVQPNKIEESLEKLIKWYNKEQLPIIEKIAILHLKLENICPFEEKNEIVSRLIINYELIKNGFLPIIIKNSDKKRYYNALKDYDNKTNPEKMIDLISDYLILRSRHYLETLH